MRERRTQTRMLCADVIEIRWKELDGNTGRSVGLLEDISRSGACFQLEGPIPNGATVTWESPEQRFSGVVRYCNYREIGYFVGVEFAAGQEWSEESFHPQHLLDVRKLSREIEAELQGATLGLTVQ